MNQEPINPDYGYILNQQLAEQPKRPNPKFVLLIITLVVGAVCFALLVFVRVQPRATDQVATKSGRQVADEYVTLMAKSEITDELLAIQGPPITDNKDLQVAALNRMKAGVNFSSCIFAATAPIDDKSTSHTYTCSTLEDDKVILTLVTTDTPPAAKITAFKVRANA